MGCQYLLAIDFFGSELKKVNSGIDLLRPSSQDLKSPVGGFLSTPKGLKVYGRNDE